MRADNTPERAHKETLNASVLWEEELKTGDRMKGRLTIYPFMNFVPSEYIAYSTYIYFLKHQGF